MADVGIVDIARVLDESKKGKAYSGQLRATAEKWQKQIAETDHKLRQTLERLAKGSAEGTPALPLATSFKLQRDKRIFELELQSLQERLRFDIETHREFYREELLASLKPTLEKIAKTNGLAMVLRSPPNGVPYAADGVDITAEVIKALAD